MRSGRRFLAKRLGFDEDAAINTFGNLRPETLVERISAYAGRRNPGRIAFRKSFRFVTEGAPLLLGQSGRKILPKIE